MEQRECVWESIWSSVDKQIGSNRFTDAHFHIPSSMLSSKLNILSPWHHMLPLLLLRLQHSDPSFPRLFSTVYVFPKQKIFSRVNKGERKFINSWIRRCRSTDTSPASIRAHSSQSMEAGLKFPCVAFNLWTQNETSRLKHKQIGWKIEKDFLKIKQKFFLLSENFAVEIFPDRNQFSRSINKSKSKCATRFIYISDARMILFLKR